MTLREQIHADVEDVFLNVDDFGETFYYLPAGGTRRTIVGTVTRERSEVIEASQGTWQKRHELEVFVSRDSTTGINDPQAGDALWRKSEGTSDPQGFSYSNMTEERDENDGTAYAGQGNGHTLLFLRYTPHKHGGLAKT